MENRNKKLFIGTISSPGFFIGHLAYLPKSKVALKFFYLDQWIKNGTELPSDKEWVE